MVDTMASCIAIYHGFILWARSFRHAQGEKEHLVTIGKFLWMTPECWWHQSDHRTFNKCVISACWGLSSHTESMMAKKKWKLGMARCVKWQNSIVMIEFCHFA